VSKNDRHISKPRWLDKSRALYRRACKRDPSLSPLLPAAGKVEVKDAIRVVLPIIGGEAAYTIHPVGGWRFEFTSYEYSGGAALADVEVAAAPAVVPPAAALDAQMKQMGDAMALLQQMDDTMVDLFVDLERRVFAGLERRMSAFEANHHLPNNVVNIAAE
jgi:hypothetical protein